MLIICLNIVEQVHWAPPVWCYVYWKVGPTQLPSWWQLSDAYLSPNSHELYAYADTYDMYVHQNTQPMPRWPCTYLIFILLRVANVDWLAPISHRLCMHGWLLTCIIVHYMNLMIMASTPIALSQLVLILLDISTTHIRVTPCGVTRCLYVEIFLMINSITPFTALNSIGTPISFLSWMVATWLPMLISRFSIPMARLWVCRLVVSLPLFSLRTSCPLDYESHSWLTLLCNLNDRSLYEVYDQEVRIFPSPFPEYRPAVDFTTHFTLIFHRHDIIVPVAQLIHRVQRSQGDISWCYLWLHRQLPQHNCSNCGQYGEGAMGKCIICICNDISNVRIIQVCGSYRRGTRCIRSGWVCSIILIIIFSDTYY